MVSILKARWAEIWVDGDRFETLKNFFEADLADPIFINDLVFFEDRKKIAQKWNSNTETWGDVMLAFPIFEKNGSRVCGILTL